MDYADMFWSSAGYGPLFSHATSSNPSTYNNDSLLSLISQPPGAIKSAWPRNLVEHWLSSPRYRLRFQFIIVGFPHFSPSCGNITLHNNLTYFIAVYRPLKNSVFGVQSRLYNVSSGSNDMGPEEFDEISY